MDIKTITTSTETKEGVWIPYPDDSDVSFKLAYTGENEYVDYTTERLTKARRGRRDVPQERVRAIMIDALSKFIVRDWKGLESDGKPWPYSVENAKNLLTSSTKLRDFVVNEASEMDNFSKNGASAEPEETATGALKSDPEVVA